MLFANMYTCCQYINPTAIFCSHRRDSDLAIFLAILHGITEQIGKRTLQMFRMRRYIQLSRNIRINRYIFFFCQKLKICQQIFYDLAQF